MIAMEILAIILVPAFIFILLFGFLHHRDSNDKIDRKRFTGRAPNGWEDDLKQYSNKKARRI